MMASETTVMLCAQCRQLKPWREFKWVYNDKPYCSEKCVNRASAIPMPRKPSE
jgi:endogenous inhibitor of DNA gyrase (YacG/DUF329 family)